MKKRIFKRKITTVQMIVFIFLAVILMGGILLSLPITSKSGEGTSFLDALFSATSAVCVTGLSTVNTADNYNVFGQTIMMILMEVGGIGVMTLPVVVLLAFGKRVNLKMRIILKDALNLNDISGGIKFMLHIVKLSLVIQLAGVALLMTDFVPRLGWSKGIFFSVFHSISAFCNAGFDIFGDSMGGFQQNPFILLVLSALIICGGLGFIVWRDLLQYRKTRRLSVHTKIVLSMTATLLIGSVIIFFVTEKNMAMIEGANGFDRFVNTIFLAVTPRTAGFNSVPYPLLSNAGVFLTMILMYVGGSSGSTAGGLKVTTLGVLLARIHSSFKGKDRTEFGERTISDKTVVRAYTLFFSTILIISVSTMILLMTETIPRFSGVEYVIFEVFSAFGTVGSTLGLTPDLSVIGKIVIMLLMFIGRVGLFTIGLSLVRRDAENQGVYKFPEEQVIIG